MTAVRSCASPFRAPTATEERRTRFRCVPTAVRALRGATTLDADTTAQMEERVRALLLEMLERNGVHHDDIISIIFTATDDLHALFPATAARALGLGDLPLLCARELGIEGATPRCVRVLMHLSTERVAHDLRHVYLEDAQGLNDELNT
ncbi:MAG: chorismate mutase [Acidimicrobiia bacterium]|nr:chorismate mutase [Acidimicrobiia bacterium]